MPVKSKRPCGAPGCAELVRRGRYCRLHARLYERRRGTAAQRGYGAEWRRLRAEVLEAQPLCADPFSVHREAGERVLATTVDHIVSRRRGGLDSLENLQALCGRCHSRKTAESDGRWG